MLGNCRKFAIAALACIMVLGPAAAQDVPEADAGPNEQVIGPRELREFQLPGTASRPAPEEPPPPVQAEPTPPAADSPPAENPPPRLEIPPPVFTEQRGGEEPVATRETNAGETATRDAQDSTASTPATASRDTVTGSRTAVEGAEAARELPRPNVVPEPAGAGTGFPWLYVAAALLLAGLGFVGGRFLHKRSAAGDDIEAFAQPEVPAPAPQPVAATPSPRPDVTDLPRRPAPRISTPAPALAGEGGTIGIQMRPWLKLQFKPERAAATDTEAAVHYELIVSNTGNAAARKVRIQARMFNAGADQEREISAFFSNAANGGNGARELSIPPRSSARVRNVVAMPKDQVREITIEGRRLFVPMVAFNVFYEWGDGKSGQTSMSYLVGRESEKPSDKMGAFRLDLGPRVYRSVGQRASDVAVLV